MLTGIPPYPQPLSPVALAGRLDADDVHVWAVPCGDPPVAGDRLWARLSGPERQRALRFRRPDDRLRAVVGRGLLRTILAECVGCAPGDLILDEGEHGKPALRGGEPEGIQFNVSHSGEWVVIGVARGVAIGVDVEQVRPVPELDVLAERFLTAAEARAIRSLAGAAKLDAFFACWTCKEAYAKATGAGLGLPLDCFEVVVRPDMSAAVVRREGRDGEAARWTLRCAAPAPGYLATVAAESPSVTVRWWYWTGRMGLAPWDVGPPPGVRPDHPHRTA